ncbi:MAG: CHAT domain-containing protein, partial [Bacteroidetes bacterium]|nr:CHAT domain-containing protein [Bacteroidota bacterium]
MKKILPIFFIFSFSFFISPAQEYHVIDSLKSALNTIPGLDGTDSDTSRMKVVLSLAEHYEKTNPDSALFFYHSIIDTSIIDPAYLIKKEETCERKYLCMADALMTAGQILFSKSNLGKAFYYWKSGLKIYEEFNETKGISRGLNALGIIELYQGNFESAKSYFIRSLKLKEEINDQNGMLGCLNNLGIICYYQSNFIDAQKYYLRAFNVAKNLNNVQGQYSILNNLGNIFYLQGDYQKGSSFYKQALTLAEHLGNIHGIISCMNNLGNISFKQGNYRDAIKTFAQTLKMAEGTNDHSSERASLVSLTTVYTGQGNYEAAILSGKRALGLFRESGEILGLAGCYNSLGVAYKKLNKFTEAIENYQLALQYSAQNDIKSEKAGCLMNLGIILIEQQEYVMALNHFSQALEIFEDSGDKMGISACLLCIGGIHLYKENYETALSFFMRSQKIREEVGAWSEFAEVTPNLVEAFVRTGSPDNSIPILLKSREITLEMLHDNFSILSEKEKEMYLERTTGFFNCYNEFFLLHGQEDSCLGFCYDGELLLKGLLLNSTKGMLDAISNTEDTTIANTYWKLKQNRDIISTLQAGNTIRSSEMLDSLERLVNEQERILVNLSSEFAGLQKQFEYNWQDVKRNLLENEAAIEFVQIKHSLTRPDTCKTDSVSYAALILRPGYAQPTMVALCNEQSLQELMKKNDLSDAEFVGNLYDQVKGAKLYELLWKPMDKLLVGVNSVYMAPVGILNQIAYSALPCPDGKLLLEKYNINLVSSTRILIDRKNEALLADGNAVVYGGIKYNTDETLADELAAINDVEKEHIAGLLRKTIVSESWPYLPGTASEAENVSKL